MSVIALAARVCWPPVAAMVRSCCHGKDVMSRKACAEGRCAAQQDERYPHLKVGRETAMAWARRKQKDEPSPSKDVAHAVSLTATSTRSRTCNYETKACDKIKKKSCKEGCKQLAKGAMRTSPLRHPGQGTQRPAGCQFTRLEADIPPTEAVASALEFGRPESWGPELDADPIQDFSETIAAKSEQEANNKTTEHSWSSSPECGNSSSGGNPVKLEPIAVDSDRDWYQSDGERSGAERLAHDK